MSTYKAISLQDLDDAEFNLRHQRYRTAAFHFQQFAEKGAKALLEKKNVSHKAMRSHRTEDILAAYDEVHKTSDIADKARYLTSFDFNARYAGDYYSDITEAQAQKAHRFALDLKAYFDFEWDKLNALTDVVPLNIEELKKLEI